MINIDNIKRNSRDFSFIDSLGSFIGNYEFKEGYNKFKLSGDKTKYGYIWSVLSSIGDTYAETIYENVLNYLDNVSNVDLCKIKNLQSMIKILGIDYNIVNDVTLMPVEILNLIDILSINKHYLLDNLTFANTFINELSSYLNGTCFTSYKFNSSLSDEIGSKIGDNGNIIEVNLSDFNDISSYLDEDKYYNFLVQLYKLILEKYVYLKYADSENGLSTKYEYIYEYIKDKLITKINTETNVNDEYEEEIRLLKIKYRLEHFKQDEIVDDIENGYDYLDRYNTYQLIILKKEIEYRSASYPGEKVYLDDESTIGFNITRYSYYREKKVKEYFNFILNTYNSLILTDEIYSSVLGIGTTNISVYEVDENYFNVESRDLKYLLIRDDTTGKYEVLTKLINALANLLADLTLELAELRELIKLQLRKSYLKGTFLLISYIINEYLKYNISKHYGDVFYSQDNVSLGEFINNSIIEGDNVELIEYYDLTEYYNISSDSDNTVENDLSNYYNIKIKNKSDSNSKFWDNLESKIGETTRELPLNEIDEFYRKLLKMNLNGIETSANLVNFLSIIYSYGANNTFWDENNDQFMCQVKSQDLSSNEWIGDVDTELEKIEINKQKIQSFIDEVNKQIGNGYLQELTSIGAQLNSLSNFVSSYWFLQISSTNSDILKSTILSYNDYIDTNDQFIVDIDNLKNDFAVISSNEKYYYYLSGYSPIDYPSGIGRSDLAYLCCQLSTFSWSCLNNKNGIKFSNDDLLLSIDNLSSEYIQNKSKLSTLIEKYVKLESLWPYFYNNSSDEITAQTRDLADYLQSKLDEVELQVLLHMLNHLDKLIGYKEEINNMIELFYLTSATYDNYYESVRTGTDTDLTKSYTSNFCYWDGQYIKGEKILGYFSSEYNFTASAIKSSDTITEKLTKLEERCKIYKPGNESLRKCYGPDKNEPYEKAQKHTHADSKEMVWLELYSPTIVATIVANLEKLVTDFGVVLLMINIELDCLGSDIGSISITGLTVDNIGSKIQDLYSLLIDKIDLLDGNYIKLVIPVESDAFYSLFINKKNALLWILNVNPLEKDFTISGETYHIYNVKSIENLFYSIYSKFNLAKEVHKNYLQEYQDTGTSTIGDLLAKIKTWSLLYDLENKNAIVKSIKEIFDSYIDLNSNFNVFVNEILYIVIINISDTLEYIISQKKYDGNSSKFLELYTNYVKNWLLNKINYFNINAILKINEKVPSLSKYLLVIGQIEGLMLLLLDYLDEDEEFLTDVLQELIEKQDDRAKFIEKSRLNYESQKEIYLKYSGTDIGYDPFYNYKNQTHSSYLIHPYLNEFIEKSNLTYSLANTFYISFGEDYEKEMLNIGLDNIIGKYGNVINLWKYGMHDWTGYLSYYEYASTTTDITKLPDSYCYGGAFYPPALEEYLADTLSFIQKVQDNTKDSYYYKLNLSQKELNRISELLRIYEPAIREITLSWKSGNKERRNPSLSNEYDIYKYTENVYGDSLILFKSYDYIVDRHSKIENTNELKKLLPDRWYLNDYGNWEYHPTFNEKKNAPGELWIRIKNHPIAFPAFDLRSEQKDYSFFNLDEENIHEYIESINDYFSVLKYFLLDDGYGNKLYNITRDSISRGDNSQSLHLRCFFDIELDSKLKTIFLVTPYLTGENHNGLNIEDEQERPNIWLSYNTFTYSNSNIIVGLIEKTYDYGLDINKYTFTKYSNSENSENVTNNIDNIKSPLDLIRVNSKKTIEEIYDFIGFSKYGTNVYSIFIHKYYPTMKFKDPYKTNAKIQMHIYYVRYNGSKLEKFNLYQDLKYDILYKTDEKYRYANNIAITFNNEYTSICYISEEFLTICKNGKNYSYTADSTIVNFIEYTSMIDNSNSLSICGENINYPSDTAILQTTDSLHINIYNSFDSFTSYLVNIDLKFSGKKIISKQIKYYNLDVDIGYIPLFADSVGKSRVYNNSALSSKTKYYFLLLGPENSDVDYTPVIVDLSGDKFGRVVENYKEFSKTTSYSSSMTISSLQDYCTYTFDLKEIFGYLHGESIYDTLINSSLLTNYTYTFSNTSYSATPIAKGKLTERYPSEYYYLSSEKYDLLSGREIIGPNGISYQGIKPSNHIDNISSIQLEVIYDEIEKLPKYINVSCYTRILSEGNLIIPDNKFLLLLYAKNSLGSYDYYHIIENANNLLKNNEETRMSRQEENEIEFSKISSLSEYQLESGKKPFENINKSSSRTDLMSAMLEFKYSEEETIDLEFPLFLTEIEDEVLILNNENKYIYFYTLDDFKDIDIDTFSMDIYDGLTLTYKSINVNTKSKKYQDYYNNAMTIEVTYNVEESEENGKYDIVLYFNYKNYTSPCYIDFDKGLSDSYGKYPKPTSKYYSSTSDEIKNTYLVLKPGKKGKLQLKFDYLEYAKISSSDIGYSIVGKESRLVKTYYIMNVSDDKPKFIISKKLFS